MTTEHTLHDDPSALDILPVVVGAPRRPRRQRPRGWRLRVAKWLRRIADLLAPLN